MAYCYVRSKDVRLWNNDVRSENRRRRYGKQPGRVDNISLSIKINAYRIKFRPLQRPQFYLTLYIVLD